PLKLRLHFFRGFIDQFKDSPFSDHHSHQIIHHQEVLGCIDRLFDVFGAGQVQESLTSSEH
ncbi:hypothetical protein PMAYCL1PPCAC_01268, partial [Pristionchus mayeri]